MTMKMIMMRCINEDNNNGDNIREVAHCDVAFNLLIIYANDNNKDNNRKESTMKKMTRFSC